MPATSVPRYERVRLLGAGGAGRVWLVRDRNRAGQLLALKELASVEAGRAGSLRREFETLHALRHPNLVEVYELQVDEESGLPSFSLEFIDGVDLVQSARDEGAETLIVLAAEALRAIAFLHDFGLIHRDLKPGNLLVRREPREGARLVVLDFGLALRAASGEETQLAGTLPYMAPELFEGGGPSRRTDLYALGAVLHEAIHGRPPESAVVTNAGDSAFSHGTVTMHSALLAVPNEFAAWVRDLTAPDPDRRPATARDALARLNATCGSRQELETRTTRASRLASGPPPGRARELASLWDFVAGATPSRITFVTGDAGAGKSRVLRWLIGEVVASGGCALTPDAIGESSRDPGPILASWERRAANGLTVVVLDELESADPLVVDLLERVAREPGSSPLRVVAGLRPAEAHDKRLRQLLDDVGWVPTLARVDLPPLGAIGISEVVERVTGGVRPAEAQLAWLESASEGNPLLLESLLVEGAWETGLAPEHHASIDASIDRRLQRLVAPARCWLEAFAVLGTGSHEVDISNTAQLESLEVAAATHAIRIAGLCTVADGVYSAPRSLLDRIRGQLSPEASRVLHRRAVEVLATRADPARQARLWRGAGESEQSIHFATAAAREAGEAGRPAEAAGWYRFALEQIAHGDQRRRDLRLAQADALIDAQEFGHAIRALGTPIRLSKLAADRGFALSKRAYAMAMVARGRSALRVADEALAVLQEVGPGLASGWAKRARAMALYRLQREEETIPVARAAAAEFARTGNQREAAACVHVAGLAASNLRRFDEAEVLLQNALDLAGRVDDQRLSTNVLTGLGLSEARRWNHRAALAFYDRALREADRAGLRAQKHVVLTSKATPLIELGRYDEALSVVAEAEPLALHLGHRNWFISESLMRGEALLRAGRPGEAIAVLSRALETRAEYEARFARYLKVTLAEALLEEAEPDHARVRDLLREVLEDPAIDRKSLFGALVTEMERRSRAGEPLDELAVRFDAEVARDRALLDPPWEVRAALARASSLLASGNTDESAARARAALAVAETRDLPDLAARLHGLLAECERQAGRLDAARGQLERATARLDEAATRIGDETLRADFLSRAVFRAVRRSELAASAAADRRLEAIYEMVHELNSETEPERMIERILDMALRVVNAERGLVLLREEGGEHTVRVARNLERETIEDATEFSRGVVLAAGAGRSVLAVDAGDDPRLRELRSVSLFGIRSVLCVPLRSTGGLDGAVYLDNRKAGPLFTPDDLRFLEAFADLAALALDNARAIERLRGERRRLEVAAEARTRFGDLVGRSAAMQRVYRRIEQYAASTLPVLVLGETGTGKELAARMVHDLGPRARRPFLVENCAAVPETLLESELFGHVRGAFTGAERDRAGLFEQADGGTLFLDEIGDTSPGMQARLLRIVQEGELRRVGGEERIRVDVRLVAATHKDLEREVAAGRFREDLLHRIRVLVLELPPLRERPGDVALLVAHFLERLGRERGAPAPRVAPEVLELLERQTWPGNVRQLENTLQRLVLLAGEGPVTRETVAADDTLSGSLLGAAAPRETRFTLAGNEREQIRQALAATSGNRERAARLLGISRATMFRRIKEYGLS